MGDGIVASERRFHHLSPIPHNPRLPTLADGDGDLLLRAAAQDRNLGCLADELAGEAVLQLFDRRDRIAADRDDHIAEVETVALGRSARLDTDDHESLLLLDTRRLRQGGWNRDRLGADPEEAAPDLAVLAK